MNYSLFDEIYELHSTQVCGLGMGVMAALLLTMNVFAEFAGPGTIGLPRAMKVYQPALNFLLCA